MAPLHRDVRSGPGEETQVYDSVIGTRRGGGGGVTGILKPPIHGIILQITGEVAHGGGLQLGDSYFEYEEGAEAVGTNVSYPGAGGGEHAGLRQVLQGRGPIRPDIQVRDMGPDALGV